MIFIKNLGVTRRLYSFRLDVESKTGKEMPESSRKDFCQSKVLPINQTKRRPCGNKY